MNITRSFPLSKHTTFRTGGNAQFFAEVDSAEELSQILRLAEKQRMPHIILGEGSNVLVADVDFPGYVIRPHIMGIELEGDTGLLIVGAGEHWDNVVAFAVSRNLAGIENLSFIPGSTGAAPVQNIGAYGTELSDVLEWVEVFDTVSDSVVRLTKSECQFAYRDSVFKKPKGKHLIILRVALRLAPGGAVDISYKDLAKYFMDSKPTLAEVREAVIKIRTAKLPDIAKVGTAGSFFKNPIISEDLFVGLEKKFPGLPSFSEGKNHKKIPLAWILDKVCGLNGYREGNVGLFETQPLALVNFGTATANEIKNFAEKISEIVKTKTNIEIEWEVNKINFS